MQGSYSKKKQSTQKSSQAQETMDTLDEVSKSKTNFQENEYLSKILEESIQIMTSVHSRLSKKTVRYRDQELDNMVSDASKLMDKMRSYLRMLDTGEKNDR